MSVTMYDRAGNAVQVPEAQALQAYQSGQLGLPEGATLPVLDRAGNLQQVGTDQLHTLTPDIYRVESPEEASARQLQEQHGGFGQQVLTGIESGASAATLGGSDVLASAIGGDEYRAARLAREQANPAAATTGEVVGTVAPLLLGGGASAASKAIGVAGAPVRGAAAAGHVASRAAGGLLTRLGVTGKSVLGKGVRGAVEMAAGGAVEAGLYGAGQALSEAALEPDGNYDKLAQKLLAGFKEGAKAGAVAGAILGGGVGLTSGVASKVSQSGAVKRIAGDLSDSAAVRAIDPSKKAMRELVSTKRVASTGRELMEHDIVAAGRSTDEMLARATAVKEEAGVKIGQLLKQVDDAGAKVETAKLFTKVDELTTKLREGLSVADDRIAARIDDTLSKVRAKPDLTFQELHQFRSRLDQDINWAKIEAPPAVQRLRDIRGIVENEIENQADAAFKKLGLKGEFLSEYKAAKKTFGASKWAETQLTDNLARGQANRAFGLTDTIAAAGGMALGGTPLTGMATAALAGAANKVAREKAWGVIATLAKHVERTDAKIAATITKALKPAHKAAHLAESGARAYKGSEAARATGKAARSAGLQQVAEQKVSRIDQVLGTKKGESREDAYRRKLASISETGRQGADGIQKKLGVIASYAPNTAVGMAARMARANEYLQSIAPVGLVDEQSLTPHLEKVRVDPVSLAKWTRAVQTVEEPLSVLDELAEGTLTRDHIQALKFVDPDLYEDIRAQVVRQITDLKEPPAYERRIQLGLLLNIPADKSLRPSSIQTVQQLHQAAAVQPEPPAPMPVRERSKTIQTDLQRLESGVMDQ